MDFETELERQIKNLIDKGYPQLSGRSVSEFTGLMKPLFTQVKNLDVPEPNLQTGKLPFVVVVKSDLASVSKTMPLVIRGDKMGIVKLNPLEPTDFLPISDVSIPDKSVYLLIDIDRGKESLDMPPIEAMEQIRLKNRSPLTIEEGVAIVTHFPEFLMKNNCFSLLASRHTGDKRVPALWINAHKNPNLGWCWNGNPHTWLGSASCLNRI